MPKIEYKEMSHMKNFLHLFVVLILILTMSGCTAALVGGGAAGGYAAGTDERTLDRMMDDSTITSHIKNEMIKDETVKARKIDVDTVRGHVTLTGVVETKAESRRAMEIARSVNGVKSVKNNLQIGKKTWTEAVNDNYLVSKIKSKLIVEPEIRSLNIDVDVHRGVVTLTGIVQSWDQKKRAIEIARNTDGALRVVDNLKLRN
jgi:hyperosmotically inducible protein